MQKTDGGKDSGRSSALGAASVRPRLLFLCQTVPFPPDGGVWIRTYNVVRLLARRFELTMLCFERAVASKQGFSENGNAEELRRYGLVEVFEIPQRHSGLRFVKDHASSLIRRRVFTRYLYESGSFRRRLSHLLREQRFDLVHVDSLDLSGYLPMLMGRPVICVHHNVESQLLRRRATLEASWLRRRYSSVQARLMEAEDRAWCPRVTLNVAVSPDDRTLLGTIAPSARCEVVPNGVDTEYFRPVPATAPGGERIIVCVGGTNWLPNRDALLHFCADILPLIRRRAPGVKVMWIGACSDADRQRFASEYGVELTGYVPDIRPLVHKAGCYVVPLRLGGGTRLKIVDAWAMGKAVVSTSVGCEGLATRPGENILVADSDEDFAAATLRVLSDSALQSSVGASGRRTAEMAYSWEAIAAPMEALYLNVLEASVGK